MYRDRTYGLFRKQMDNAKRRGIAWHLTFEQWQRIWKESGKWNERGIRLNQYCMCRPGDRGPYAIGNVEIKTVSENHREMTFEHTDSFKQKMSAMKRGNGYWHNKNHSDNSKRKISESNKGRVGGFTGKRHSEATIRLKRKSW